MGFVPPAPLRLLQETHACPTVLDLLFPHSPGELVMATVRPCTLCKGHQEAETGLSQLQCLISATCFTEGTQIPTEPEVRLRPDTTHHMWLQCH